MTYRWQRGQYEFGLRFAHFLVIVYLPHSYQS
jgi:hypothetical protein